MISGVADPDNGFTDPELFSKNLSFMTDTDWERLNNEYEQRIGRMTSVRDSAAGRDDPQRVEDQERG